MGPYEQPRKMLIVDDEPVITDSLVKIFRNEGYETRGVHSAEEARDLFSSWVPDFAIVDVRLPNMNGVDLAILIKAEYPQCRLILFSGEMTTTKIITYLTQQRISKRVSGLVV